MRKGELKTLLVRFEPASARLRVSELLGNRNVVLKHGGAVLNANEIDTVVKAGLKLANRTQSEDVGQAQLVANNL